MQKFLFIIFTSILFFGCSGNLGTIKTDFDAEMMEMKIDMKAPVGNLQLLMFQKDGVNVKSHNLHLMDFQGTKDIQFTDESTFESESFHYSMEVVLFQVVMVDQRHLSPIPSK